MGNWELELYARVAEVLGIGVRSDRFVFPGYTWKDVTNKNN
jgi:hypothetical protein